MLAERPPAIRAEVHRFARKIASTMGTTWVGVSFDQKAAKPPTPLTVPELAGLADGPEADDPGLAGVASEPTRLASHAPSWRQTFPHGYDP
jgi:hypothetical protein